jgi:ribonuclease VapC
MVIDTSAVLSLFEEPTAQWILEQIESHDGPLLMSTVNLAETMILLRSRLRDEADRIESQLLGAGLNFVAPTAEHARLAATARLKFPLNLGDCFAYALSAIENQPILTLDEDFRRCDRPLLIPPRTKNN